MDIALVVYPGVTALDIVGPYEVLSRLPGATATFVAAEAGAVTTDTGRLTLSVSSTLDQIGRPDVVVVPGGPVANVDAAAPSLAPWLAAVHPHTRFTASVCTGSLILAAAGLLDGVEATTHWTRMDRLARSGAVAVRQRVVRSGRIFTAAGVSAGLDMALTLAAELATADVARAIQLGIEYDPDPPFAAGSPDTAPPEIVALVRGASPDQ